MINILSRVLTYCETQLISLKNFLKLMHRERKPVTTQSIVCTLQNFKIGLNCNLGNALTKPCTVTIHASDFCGIIIKADQK